MADLESKLEEAAESVTEEAQAGATESIATAAAVTVAAAETAAALASGQAAQVIQKSEGDMEWLRQHAMNTDASLSNLAQSMGQIGHQVKTETQALLEQTQEKILGAVGSLLTQHLSKSEQTAVNPKAESEAQDGQQEAEKSQEKSQPRRGPKYRDNWI